jgi:hypothetical protein
MQYATLNHCEHIVTGMMMRFVRDSDAASWRNIAVRFTAAGLPGREIVRVAAVSAISSQLVQLRATEQVVCLVETDWATWTFMPGTVEPIELLRITRRVLTSLDPGWWHIQADDFPSTTNADPTA